MKTTIRPELAQSLEEYRRAFIVWAVAAYAVEIEPQIGGSPARLLQMHERREVARWHRDDTHIQFMADLFAYGGEGADDATPDEGATLTVGVASPGGRDGD